MLRLFALAIFLSAALLFLVQPMTGKVLLPMLGGSPAVWSTCMVFFQAVLLAGYLYAHALTSRATEKTQRIVHVGVLLAAGAHVAYAALSENGPVARLTAGVPVADAASPTLSLVLTLALLVGPGFFAVSTSGPLLQRWFSRTDHRAAKDPYFLYAASNAGSFVGLLAYPLLVEPLLSRATQFMAWGAAFVALVALVAWGAVRARPRPEPAARAEVPASSSGGPPALAASPPSNADRLRWIVLSLVPSSLMLGVTQHISTDVAAIPLLWVLPLSLYLLSFVWAFSPRVAPSARWWGRVAPFALLGIVIPTLAGATYPILVIAGLHVGGFLVLAMLCHTRLAESRPPAAHLTEFYLCLSLGGVLGGVLNALVAPVVFEQVLEYPLVLGLALLLRPQTDDVLRAMSPRRRLLEWGVAGVAMLVLLVGVLNLITASQTGVILAPSTDGAGSSSYTALLVLVGIPTFIVALTLVRRGSVRFAGAVLGVMLGATLASVGAYTLDIRRTFFGVHAVASDQANTRRELRHGTTLHGIQLRTDFVLGDLTPYPDAEFRRRLLFARGNAGIPREERIKFLHLIPTTYYHPTGPIGDVMRELTDSGRLDRVALIGLGTGSLLAYARPNSSWDIYEIDPAVLEFARTPAYFSYITDAMRDPTVRVASPARPGDGRVDIASAPAGTYRLIVIDAFSSDAIPVHLITLEAVRTYLRVLADDGILAFHVSSRYFELAPVLARIGEEENLTVRMRLDPLVLSDEAKEAKRQSDWVVLARSPAALGSLALPGAWQAPPPSTGTSLWTDDYSDLLGSFQGWWLPEE
ncbi:MAG: hypothetical protein SFY69_05630 [Planctomycetota bacterium]|nr:hypothetical protein [Planctomycetota bacterium]